MTWIAYGAPGAEPRFGQDERHVQLAPGDVAVMIDVLPAGRVVIAADGKALAAAVPTLAEAKRARWIDAKAYRAQRMAAGCATPKGRVQTDDRSIRVITQQAAIAANNQTSIVPPWSILFTMADNTDVAHSAAEMMAMEKAVGAYTAACHAASKAIRKAIFGAASTAAVAAVDIAAGYPT